MVDWRMTNWNYLNRSGIPGAIEENLEKPQAR
jgi:hypothetical protein